MKNIAVCRTELQTLEPKAVSEQTLQEFLIKYPKIFNFQETGCLILRKKICIYQKTVKFNKRKPVCLIFEHPVPRKRNISDIILVLKVFTFMFLKQVEEIACRWDTLYVRRYNCERFSYQWRIYLPELLSHV